MTDLNKGTQQAINQARLAIVAAYTLTSIHHIYGGLVDAVPTRLLVPVLMALPLLLALWSLHRYRRTGSSAALSVFTVVAVLVFSLLLGIVHGGYGHVYKDILFLTNASPEQYFPLNPDEHYPPDNLFFEITGVLDTAAGFIVAFHSWRLVREHQRSTSVSPGRAQAHSSL